MMAVAAPDAARAATTVRPPIVAVGAVAAGAAVAKVGGVTTAKRAKPPVARVGGQVPGDVATSLEPAAGPLPGAYTPGPRRDPVIPPLAAQDAWTEWVLAVSINNRPMPDGGVFFESPTGRLAVRLADLDRWRLRYDTGKAITLQGEPVYPLDALADARFALDRASLSLTLAVPPEAFDVTTVDEDDPASPRALSGTGAYLDYDVQAEGGDGLANQIGGLMEAGLFGTLGVFRSSLLGLDLAGRNAALTRLETTFSRDFPNDRTSLYLGDAITSGGSFGVPVRFGGIQYTTNFATDPAFVTFPLPSIGGLAEQPSVVDVIVNNVQQTSSNLPPGPFQLDSLPAVTGAGEVQLVVTDLLGRQQIVTQPYYLSSRVLRAGLDDYAVEIGAERLDYGSASFDYGQALAAGTWRRGLNDSFTGEVHAELQPERQSAAFGGAFVHPDFGLLAGGVGVSRDDTAGGGYRAQLEYEYLSSHFRFGARTVSFSPGFRALGIDETPPARIDQLDIGLDMRGYGSLGVLLINADQRDAPDELTLVTNYSLPVGPGWLLISAARSFSDANSYGAGLTYTIPLSGARTVSATTELRDGDGRGRVQYRRGRLATDLGLTYVVAAEAGKNAQLVDAALQYDATHVTGTLAATAIDGRSAARAGLTGSVVYVDGAIGATRRLGPAFGVVRLPDFPNVRVYLDNRDAGRTDARGELLLPNLQPYQNNRVRLDVRDLPLDARLGDAEMAAVPVAGAGVSVRFDVAHVQRATAVLRNQYNEALPAGSRLANPDGTVTVWLGKDGFAQVTGAIAQPVTVRPDDPASLIACTLPPPATDEPVPDLGLVRCVASAP